MKTIDQVFAEWESVGVVTPRIEVVKGQKYLCLVALPVYLRKFAAPLIPFLHSDGDISDSAGMPHYHLDTRFLTSTQLESISGLRYATNKGRTGTILIPSLQSVHLEVKMVTCRRSEPTGLPLCTDRGFNKWADKYTGKSCKGKKCPHWGMPMVERGGLLECPMHGLIGSATTERIIPREQGVVLIHRGDPCEL